MGRLKNKKARVDLSRPSIDITPTKRHWVNINADDLEVGDILAGHGLIQAKSYVMDPHCVRLMVGVEPHIHPRYFDVEEIVFAFVQRKDS